MKSIRLERINSELEKVINNIIATELRDPQIDAIISVTSVDTTPDLAHARVYISSIGNTPPDEVLARIKGAGGFIRGEVSKRIKLRVTPRLEFYKDSSIEYGNKIDNILKTIKYSTDGEEPSDD